MASSTRETKRTVPSPPVIVPVHWKMLSPSGNAEREVSPLIMRDMSSDCSLREVHARTNRHEFKASGALIIEAEHSGCLHASAVKFSCFLSCTSYTKEAAYRLFTLCPAAEDEGAACLPELALPIEPPSAFVDMTLLKGSAFTTAKVTAMHWGWRVRSFDVSSSTLL